MGIDCYGGGGKGDIATIYFLLVFPPLLQDIAFIMASNKGVFVVVVGLTCNLLHTRVKNRRKIVYLFDFPFKLGIYLLGISIIAVYSESFVNNAYTYLPE